MTKSFDLIIILVVAWRHKKTKAHESFRFSTIFIKKLHALFFDPCTFTTALTQVKQFCTAYFTNFIKDN